jgi:hypothetical protein
MRIKIELEFDENDLGQKWMNPDTLDLLLYTKICTKKELLKVINYEEINENELDIKTSLPTDLSKEEKSEKPK